MTWRRDSSRRAAMSLRPFAPKGSQELPAGIRVVEAHQRRKEHRRILVDSAGMLVAAVVIGGRHPGPGRLP